MLIKKKKRARRLYGFVIGLSLLVLIFREEIRSVKDFVNLVFLPVKEIIYTFSYNAKKNLNTFVYINDIAKENRRLSTTLFELKLDLLKLEELEEENDRLRELLNMEKKNKYEFIVADIIYRDSYSVYEGFYINKGTEDGIAKDMVVMHKDSLLGKVVSVTKKSSKVEILTKKDYGVSVLTNDGKNLGILKGNNRRKLDLNYIIVDADINKGDKVITSGISDIYPKGLNLGKITSIAPGSDNLFKKIEVELPYNILDLDEVIVLTDKKEKVNGKK